MVSSAEAAEAWASKRGLTRGPLAVAVASDRRTRPSAPNVRSLTTSAVANWT
jgi:hypothetical protein